jgi:hypothetical protein
MRAQPDEATTRLVLEGFPGATSGAHLQTAGRGTVRTNSAQKERPPEGGPTFRGDLLQAS